MSLYDWLKFLHILAAMLWVGGGVAMDLAATRMVKGGEQREVLRLLGTMEWLGSRLFGPAAIVVLGLGLTMVAITEAWTIGQLWIVLALVVFGLSFLLGGVYAGPESKRIAAAVEAEGPGSPEAQRRMRRLFTVTRIDMLLLVFVVWAMVFKPGL